MINTVVYVYDQAYISGGAAKIVIGEAVEMKNRGYRVIYFSAVGPICDELTRAHIEVICLNEQHIANTKNPIALSKGIYNSNSYKRLYELLNKLDNKTTVVHIHGWTKALSASVFMAVADKGFKSFLTLHEYFTVCQNGGLYDYKTQKICKKKPGSLQCHICNCDKRNYINKIYRNIRQCVQNKILKATQPYPIYITDFSEKIIRSYFPYATKSFKLTNFVEISDKVERIPVEDNAAYIFIGRLSMEKGVDLFCKAIEEMNVSGTVIGTGPLLDEYKSKYSRIDFVGWKSTAEISKYLKKARALIVSSKWYETMGLTIVEMQQYGIPCIVPKQCAGSEYILDGKTGILYDIGNLAALKEAIKKSQNDVFIHELSYNFYQNIDVNRFSINEHINHLIKIYNSTIV